VTSITMDGEPFRAARGLGNAHLQTVFAHLMRRGRTPRLERERWPTADGDVVDVDWLTAPPSAPHLMILHGLEGSSEAGYVRVLIAGADDYYARASSAPLIARIRRPLLAINADDDPMVPVASLPHAAFAANPCTTLHVTHGGGHVGFVAGSVRAPRFWAEARALGALAPLLGAKMAAHADA
jgi:predicted alpha/beta-fold hydrolase